MQNSQINKKGGLIMYFITVVDIYNETESSKYVEYNSRCVGYYAWLDDAVEAIKNNFSDIKRTICDYVVIEQIEEGIHEMRKEETWFKWNDEDELYEPADKPEEIQNPNNFSIG